MTPNINATTMQNIDSVCSRFNQGLAQVNRELESQGSKVQIVVFIQDETGEWQNLPRSELKLFKASCCPRIAERNSLTGELKRLGAVHILNEHDQTVLGADEIAKAILKVKSHHDNAGETDLQTSLGVLYNVDDVKAHHVSFDDKGYLRIDGLRVFGIKEDSGSVYVINASYLTSNSVIRFEDASDPDSVYSYDEEDQANNRILHINTNKVGSFNPDSLLRGKEEAQRYKAEEGGEYHKIERLTVPN